MYKIAHKQCEQKKLLSHEVLGWHCIMAFFYSFVQRALFPASSECSNKSVVTFFSHPSAALTFSFFFPSFRFRRLLFLGLLFFWNGAGSPECKTMLSEKQQWTRNARVVLITFCDLFRFYANSRRIGSWFRCYIEWLWVCVCLRPYKYLCIYTRPDGWGCNNNFSWVNQPQALQFLVSLVPSFIFNFRFFSLCIYHCRLTVCISLFLFILLLLPLLQLRFVVWHKAFLRIFYLCFLCVARAVMKWNLTQKHQKERTTSESDANENVRLNYAVLLSFVCAVCVCAQEIKAHRNPNQIL